MMTANPILLQKKYDRVIECFAKQQGLSLDEALGNKQQGWVSLGNFDFPGGGVKITLSNKENNQNQDIAIIADAVKFVRLE